MGRITIDLVRKRSEHNEGEIRTIKELSLHQQKLEQIENLDRWCRELEILLLQNNNISKIENVSRLKCLKYLNLALNNIEVIEGLQGCESLEKLDLTLNFIGQITSVKTLVHNIHLRTLYLTGNPCCEYPGYREYVIAHLPQVGMLDGEDITSTNRIRAKQCLPGIEVQILRCEKIHLDRRETERRAFKNTDIDIEDEDFWSQSHPNTPEVRALIQKKLELDHDEKPGNDVSSGEPNRNNKTGRRYFKDDGRPLNINDGKYPIRVADEAETGFITVEIEVPKFLDTSLISVDVQPEYVRVTVKKNVVQLCLSHEVKPDSSTVQRSTTTGALLLKMPMLDQSAVLKFQNAAKNTVCRAKPGPVNVNLKEASSSARSDTCSTGETPVSQFKDRGIRKFNTDSTTLTFRDEKYDFSVNEDEVPPLE